MEKKWRLIAEQKQDGYYNMAADEAMLDFYRHTRIPVLRLYGWDRPFVTLGCNQSVSDVLLDKSTPFTRRMSGGAAILHHDELTYSLVCSREDLCLSGGIKESYKKLCGFLISFYAQLGLEAKFACDLNLPELGGYGSVCFVSYEHYDILVNNKKIGGNAQKRGRDFIFQHGSIPITIDFNMMSKLLKGSLQAQARVASLTTVLRKQFTFDFLQKKISESFFNNFNLIACRSRWTDEESFHCRKLMKDKYLDYEWKYKA